MHASKVSTWKFCVATTTKVEKTTVLIKHDENTGKQIYDSCLSNGKGI